MLMSTQWAAFLDRLGGVTPTLLTMTLASTVAALVVMALRLALGRAPRRYIIVLWTFVLIRMFAPFGFGPGLVSLIPEPVTSGRAAEFLLERNVSDMVQTAPEVSGKAQEKPFGDPVVRSRAEQAAPGGEEPALVCVAPVQLLPVFWLTGTAGMLLWAIVTYARLRLRVSESVMTDPGVYESDTVDTPFVLNSDIYLPLGLTGEDRRYVLLHEQAHIDHSDSLFMGFAWLALSLHWFNPVLWLAYRLVCRDVEAACDQRVIEGFPAGTRREDVAGYAAALLHLGRRQRLPQGVLPFGEENAKGRIRHVLQYRRPVWRTRFLLTVLCASVGVLLLTNAPAGEEPGETLPASADASEVQLVLPQKDAEETLPRESAEKTAVPEAPSPEVQRVLPQKDAEETLPRESAEKTAVPETSPAETLASPAASAARPGQGTGEAAAPRGSADPFSGPVVTVGRAGQGRDPAAEVQSLFLAAAGGQSLDEENTRVYIRNNEISVLLTGETPADDGDLTLAAGLTLEHTDGADTLRVYDREGFILVETYGRYDAMEQEGTQPVLREEETGPADVPRLPEPGPAEEPVPGGSDSVETPVLRETEPLPDSLNFDFSQQEGAE